MGHRQASKHINAALAGRTADLGAVQHQVVGLGSSGAEVAAVGDIRRIGRRERVVQRLQPRLALVPVRQRRMPGSAVV